MITKSLPSVLISMSDSNVSALRLSFIYTRSDKRRVRGTASYRIIRLMIAAREAKRRLPSIESHKKYVVGKEAFDTQV
jgi:hypothetical protein